MKMTNFIIFSGSPFVEFILEIKIKCENKLEKKFFLCYTQNVKNL